MNTPKTTSMKDVADAVGVSRATVSNALRGKGRLSIETRQQVIDTATRLNFVPSNLGRALRTGRTATVGLVIPDFRMPLFSDFASAFAQAAAQRDLVLGVADCIGSHAAQSRHLADFMARGVDALVVIPVRGTPVIDLPQARHVLVVDAQSNPRNTISSDHYGGGYQMAEYLAKAGHGKVLVIDNNGMGDPRGGSRVNELRRAGLEAGFAAHGVTPRRLSVPARFELVRDLFMTQPVSDVTAIAATYDVLALGALHALLARGISVPDEISVTGFDDTVWGQIMHPPLTTLRQDLPGLAETAFSIALGECEPGVILPVDLIIRGSSRSLLSSSTPTTRDIDNA